MRILVDVNHPAHVHLFKHAIRDWRERGDEVRITARDKDITFSLLKQMSLDFTPIPATRPGFLGYIQAVLGADWRVLSVAREFDPDFLIGTSFAAAHISKLVRGRSVVFGEDDWASTSLFWRITVPFADHIATPDTITDQLGEHHIRYAGCHELAYLHPDRFTPEKNTLEGLIPTDQPYSIIRFVSLGAFHDKGQRGIASDEAKKIVEMLAKSGNVFITSEGELAPALEKYRLNIPPDKMHNALAYAQLLVSDSQSMTIEAALLGTPSVRINSFVGRIPVINELEEDYGLSYGFLPEQNAAARKKIDQILSDSQCKDDWKAKRDRYLGDKIELTAWMVDLLDQLSQNELV